MTRSSATLIICCALLLSLACARPPEKIGELPEGDTPLHVTVSNQSFDQSLMGIEVYIDEIHVISGDFEVGNQHSFYGFDFTATEGTHSLRAEADGGGVTLEEEFEVAGETWGVLMYWYYATPQGGAEVTPKHLAWDVYDEAPAFD